MARGEANGLGVTYNNAGQRFEGAIQDGKYHGLGVYTWPDKQYYEGMYRDDKRNGYGIGRRPRGDPQDARAEPAAVLHGPCPATRRPDRRQIAYSRDGREDTRLGLKRLQEMAYLMRDALEAGEPDTVGAMLGSAFEAKKQMNPHIAEHTPIEAMLAAARGAGAAGGKICGAGGGGYLLVNADPDVQPSVRRELERLDGQMAPIRLHPDGVRAFRGDATWAPAG